MTIEWLVPLGQARAMTMALQSLTSDIRAMRGCRACSVSTELANGIIVRYVEEWRTEADLRNHVRSEKFLRLVALIEDATAPPRIEFALASVIRGLEYIAEVRRSLA
jgi:quinol monooxygenase YgiN